MGLAVRRDVRYETHRERDQEVLVSKAESPRRLRSSHFCSSRARGRGGMSVRSVEARDGGRVTGKGRRSTEWKCLWMDHKGQMGESSAIILLHGANVQIICALGSGSGVWDGEGEGAREGKAKNREREVHKCVRAWGEWE